MRDCLYGREDPNLPSSVSHVESTEFQIEDFIRAWNEDRQTIPSHLLQAYQKFKAQTYHQYEYWNTPKLEEYANVLVKKNLKEKAITIQQAESKAVIRNYKKDLENARSTSQERVNQYTSHLEEFVKAMENVQQNIRKQIEDLEFASEIQERRQTIEKLATDICEFERSVKKKIEDERRASEQEVNDRWKLEFDTINLVENTYEKEQTEIQESLNNLRTENPNLVELFNHLDKFKEDPLQTLEQVRLVLQVKIEEFKEIDQYIPVRPN